MNSEFLTSSKCNRAVLRIRPTFYSLDPTYVFFVCTCGFYCTFLSLFELRLSTMRVNGISFSKLLWPYHKVWNSADSFKAIKHLASHLPILKLKFGCLFLFNFKVSHNFFFMIMTLNIVVIVYIYKGRFLSSQYLLSSGGIWISPGWGGTRNVFLGPMEQQEHSVRHPNTLGQAFRNNLIKKISVIWIEIWIPIVDFLMVQSSMEPDPGLPLISV